MMFITAPRDQQSDDAAEPAKNSRLDQKLKQDLPACCADGFPQSDFKRSLSDTHQHDVHHHDAADYQRNESDRNDNLRNRARELVVLVVQLLDVHQTEIIFFVSVETMLDSHRHARIFDCRVNTVARAALAVNLKTVAPEDLKMCGD